MDSVFDGIHPKHLSYRTVLVDTRKTPEKSSRGGGGVTIFRKLSILNYFFFCNFVFNNTHFFRNKRLGGGHGILGTPWSNPLVNHMYFL